MGVSRVKKPEIHIKADTPELTEIAVMQYLVGFGLSRWHNVEQDLTYIYLMLTCPRDTPVDGALASFSAIQTIDAKAGHLIKVAEQVFYQDEMVETRKAIKKGLNRIITLNGIRNKLAHGIATERDGKAVFMPYYNFAHDWRREAFDRYGPTPSTVVPTVKWDIPKLHEEVEKLKEGPDLTYKIVHELGDLFEDGSSPLRTARRMTLDRGISYDPNPPDTPPQSGK